MTQNALLLAIITTFATSSIGFAQPPRGGPPPEAIEACDGQSDGSTCSFTGREGDALEGTCHAPQGRPLACVPEGHPRR